MQKNVSSKILAKRNHKNEIKISSNNSMGFQAINERNHMWHFMKIQKSHNMMLFVTEKHKRK